EASESRVRDEPGWRSLFPAGFTPSRLTSHSFAGGRAQAAGASGLIVRFCAVAMWRRGLLGAVLEAAAAPHPWQGPDGPHPVGERRDEAEVLFDVLLADPAGGDDLAARQRERRAEHRFQHEDALGVMP